MIGGKDVLFNLPSKADRALKWRVLKYFSVLWPNLVVEREDGAATAAKSHGWLKDASDAEELFLYPNNDAYESWTMHGATEDNRNQMLHIIWEPEEMTMVVDDAAEPIIATLVEEIREMILLERASPFKRAA